jgi:hemoglobin-like flavoprotein
VTPDQIALVEGTLGRLDLDRLTVDFYRRAFEEEPSLTDMFTSEPAVQRARFAAELDEIVRAMRSLEVFEPRVRALGEAHRAFGVQAAHYQLMGRALLGALAAALGPAWTPEVEDAWGLAYNLTAETMMIGAQDDPAPRPAAPPQAP